MLHPGFFCTYVRYESAAQPGVKEHQVPLFSHCGLNLYFCVFEPMSRSPSPSWAEGSSGWAFINKGKHGDIRGSSSMGLRAASLPFSEPGDSLQGWKCSVPWLYAVTSLRTWVPLWGTAGPGRGWRLRALPHTGQENSLEERKCLCLLPSLVMWLLPSNLHLPLVLSQQTWRPVTARA